MSFNIRKIYFLCTLTLLLIATAPKTAAAEPGDELTLGTSDYMNILSLSSGTTPFSYGNATNPAGCSISAPFSSIPLTSSLNF